MKSDYKFPYTIAIVPYALILVLASFWFFVVIPSHAADIPIRFNFSNQPEWYVHRLGFVVLFLVIEGAVAGSILFSANYWDNRIDNIHKRMQLENETIVGQIENYRKSKNMISLINLFFYFLLILVLFNYSLFYYQFKQFIDPVPVAIIAAALIIADLVITLIVIRSRERIISEPVMDDIDKQEPDIKGDHWKLGIIYYNKDDSRFFVPKRSGLGLTINHARIGLSILLYALIIAAVLFSIYK